MGNEREGLATVKQSAEQRKQALEKTIENLRQEAVVSDEGTFPTTSTQLPSPEQHPPIAILQNPFINKEKGSKKGDPEASKTGLAIREEREEKKQQKKGS